VEAAENRSHSDLGDLLAENYHDERGHNKDRITQLARAYFFRHRNIHLFTRITDIKVYNNQEADVSLLVAMTGQAVTDPSLLAGLKAHLYRFNLQLIRNDNWLLKQADWKPAGLDELE
jgi:hypothetical protein